MILHPAILALVIGSLLTGSMLAYASFYGIRILRNWDIMSGSELQLSLERRTYLISSILGYTLAFQLLSLFLFIYTADHLHSLFNGAMCAAGTLNANPFGYPLLVTKIVNFILAGIWIIINLADTRGYDYPLIRIKYAFLLTITPLIFMEIFFQIEYFTGLHADVITSCCGSLFSLDRPGLAGDLSALPGDRMGMAFYGAMTATMASGLYFLRLGKGCYLFSALSGTTFLVSVASLISFICLYYYELPTHHCPFCILQREYGYVGYFLYLTLLGGAVAGIGVGVTMPFRKRRSLARIIPAMQRRLTAVSLVSYGLFTLLISYQILISPLKLG